jgi:LacI family transcriptional regulator
MLGQAYGQCDDSELTRRPPTIRDVARRAEVHPGTASRALNEATLSLVKPETAERVMAAALALGYKPDYLARSFKTRRTFSIGVVIPDINNPLFPPIVRGVEDRLATSGYFALLANTENDVEREGRIIEGMLGRRIDGLLLATARRKDPLLAELGRQGIAVVLVNRVVEDHPFSSVSSDDRAGARMVIEHPVGLGHRQIAHVAEPQSLSTGYHRYRGFLSSMTDSGLKAGKSTVAFAARFSIAEGLRCATQLLSRPAPPTAIIAANDMLALGCYTAPERLGLTCPDDVSVVGFNDMPFIDRVHPPLTTVRIPQYELGAHAADLLLERVAEPATPIKIVLLAPQLVVRGSTGPALQRGAVAPIRRVAAPVWHVLPGQARAPARSRVTRRRLQPDAFQARTARHSRSGGGRYDCRPQRAGPRVYRGCFVRRPVVSHDRRRWSAPPGRPAEGHRRRLHSVG